MANDAAWDQGWGLGAGYAQNMFAHKQALSDEQRVDQHGVLSKARDNIQAQISTFKDENGNVKPEFKDQFDQATAALAQTQNQINQLWNPIHAPGALQRNWHKLVGQFAAKDNTPTSATVQAPAMNLPVSPSPMVSPELPAYQQQTAPQMPSKGGHVTPSTTTVPSVPASSLPGMEPLPYGATRTMVQATPKGLLEAGNIPIWNRPQINNADGTVSSEYSASFQDENGKEVLVPTVVNGKFLTPDGHKPEPGSKEEKQMFEAAWNHYQQTGEHLGKFKSSADADLYATALHGREAINPSSREVVNPSIPAGAPVTVNKAPTPSWSDAQVLKKQAAAMQKAHEQAALMAAGSPQSPAAVAQANVAKEAAERWGNLKADVANWDKANPDASPQEKEAVHMQLYTKWIQTQGRGNWETVNGDVLSNPSDPSSPRVPVSFSYDKNTNRLTHFDGTPVIPEIASSFRPYPKATGVAGEELREYAGLPDPKPAFAEWLAQKRTAGTTTGKGLIWDTATGQVKGGPNGRRYNAWDADAPPEVQDMFKSQGQMMAKKQQMALALAAARGASFAQNRIITVQDPNDPTSSIYIPAGLAARLGYKAPSGAYYQAMSNMLKSATAGTIGNEFVAFGTALQHADLLQQAALALNNKDSRALNSVSNTLATAFGDPTVTNFDVIKGAYQREITKALTSSHITDSEIRENGLSIPDNASPQQIMGALNSYRALMNSKINLRLPQILSVLPKVPFTPPGYTPPPGAASGTGQKKVSLAKAKTLARYAKMSDAAITNDLKSKNYEVGP